MPSEKQTKQITEVMKLRQIALASIMVGSAKEMSALATAETLALLKKNKYTIATAEGITDALIAEYTAGINKGGSMCIERVLTKLPNGTYKATTEKVFHAWLSDMTTQQTSSIIKLIGEAEQTGLHPRNIAKQLREYFDGTKHNAMTAARTEASKIRNDSRSETMAQNGVKYVEYITAGDDAVRPEHAMRDGKIYRHEDAPWMGEYNCRCVLSPADYKVNEGGARVETSQEEYLTPEQVGVTE